MTDVTNEACFVIPSATFKKEPSRLSDAYLRRCFRVLRMVVILHGKGFQGLRVFPYIYPLAYRIELYPVKFAGPSGVRYDEDLQHIMEEKALVARHTGANEACYFEWDDAQEDNAHQLALKFIERFPQIAKASLVIDYAYAGWYSMLLAQCEYGYLPYLFGEFEPELDKLRMHHARKEGDQQHIEFFPLPPCSANGHRLNPRPLPAWLSR